jgi:hypothetical protein
MKKKVVLHVDLIYFLVYLSRMSNTKNRKERMKIVALSVELFYRLTKRIIIGLATVSYTVIAVWFLFVRSFICCALRIPKHNVILNIWRTEFG